MAPTVEIITEKYKLGEGPHWDIPSQSLYLVDIFGQYIVKHVPATGKTTKAKVEGGPVSFIVPVEGEKDKFVISIGRKLAVVTWNGSSSTVSNTEILTEVDTHADGLKNRINDGKADPAGRLWAGTMGPEDIPGEPEMEKGTLFSLVSRNQVKNHVSKISIANGLAWNTQLKKFYYIDSPVRTVDQFDYDLEKGDISNRKTVFSFEENQIPGFPDGMTIDSEGKLWVAVFNGSRVIRIDPQTSQLLTTVNFPADQITSVAFGGPNLDVLFVTSAELPMPGKTHKPNAGATFKVTGLGVRGLPAANVKL